VQQTDHSVAAPRDQVRAPSPSPEGAACAERDTGSTFGQGRRLRPSEPAYLELLGFLWDEAAVLDRDDLTAWLELLDRDLVYTMPVRVTKMRCDASEFASGMMHFDEDRSSLAFRIKRFQETQAWSEDPPSRVRRFVTGVIAYESALSGDYDVSSSLLLVRTQDDDFRVDLVTAERRDLVRVRSDGSATLARRQILVDQSTIGTHNLAIFL
jgi:3-phenylpropionate/cinnamic acid dioxygenase small subunit